MVGGRKKFLGMVLCRTFMVRGSKFQELWSTAGIMVECRDFGSPLEVLCFYTEIC